jgi:hypothetical protein
MGAGWSRWWKTPRVVEWDEFFDHYMHVLAWGIDAERARALVDGFAESDTRTILKLIQKQDALKAEIRLLSRPSSCSCGSHKKGT